MSPFPASEKNKDTIAHVIADAVDQIEASKHEKELTRLREEAKKKS
jgi:hypothetical protein